MNKQIDFNPDKQLSRDILRFANFNPVKFSKKTNEQIDFILILV